MDTVLINPGYSFTLNLNGSTLLVTSLLNFSDAVGKIDGGGGPALGNLRVAAIFGNKAAFNWLNGSLNRTQLYVGQGLAQAPTGTLNWSGGTATDSSLSFLTDSTVQATGAKLEVDYCLLYNAGTFTTSGTISFGGGNELNTGVFDMDFGTLKTVLGAGPPAAHFVNAGTFQTLARAIPPLPGSTSTVSVTFDNNGAVVAQPNSPLMFRRDGVHTGSFKALSGSTIAFDRSVIARNGTNEVTPGASLLGQGIYDVDDGAEILVDANANIRVENFRLEQTGNFGLFSMLTIKGTFSAHVFDWNSGTVQSGVLTVGQNDELFMDDPGGTTGVFDRTLDGVSIQNHGNILWHEVFNSSGTVLMPAGDLNMMNQSVITNDGSQGQGIFTIAAGDTILKALADPKGNPIPTIQIINKGVVQNLGTTGGVPATIAVPVKNNGGTFKNAVPKKINLQSGYQQTDGLTQLVQGATVAVAGTFEQDGGTTDLGGSALTVAGVVNQSGGTVDANGGSITVTGGAYNETGGRLTIESGTVTANSVQVASGAVLSGYGAVNAAVTNAGEVDAAANNTLAVAGAYTQSAGVTNIGTYPQGGGRLTVSGLFDEQGGALNLYGYSTLQVGNGLQVRSGAALSDYGYGAITGDVTNAGSITVGDGQNVGLTLSVTGNFTQTAAGVLNLGISGPYYQNSLSVSGQASLGGTLNVSQLGGPPPQRGDSHSLIHYGSRVGQFATLNLPPISGAVWVPNYDDLDHAFILMAQ